MELSLLTRHPEGEARGEGEKETWDLGALDWGPQREVERGGKEWRRSIQTGSFLSSNPSGERRQWEKQRSLVHCPCASHSPSDSITHSFSCAACLSSHLSPPSLPLFFRHGPCVLKQLGGAAEKREGEDWRRGGMKVRGNEWGRDSHVSCLKGLDSDPLQVHICKASTATCLGA